MTVRVIVTCEVTDPDMLRAYTSGFMPARAGLPERVVAVVNPTTGHTVMPELNGVSVTSVEYDGGE